MSTEAAALLSVIIGGLLDIIIALVIVGIAYVLFQLAYGIRWLVIVLKDTHKKDAPTGAESEGV